MDFLSIPEFYFRILVLIFYANAKCCVNHDGVVTGVNSYLMGKKISLDVKSICEVFKLEDEGLDDENALGHVLSGSVTALNAQDRILHLMVSWWLRPSGGKYSTIRQVDDFWIRCFRERKRPNLARIMFAEIVYLVQHCHTTLVTSFTYGTTLSYFFLQKDIDCSHDFPTPLTDPIGERSLARGKFHYFNGRWLRLSKLPSEAVAQLENPQGEQVPQAPPPPPQPSMDALMTFLNEQFTGLRTDMASGFTTIDTRFTSLETRMTNVENRLTSLEGGHNSMNISLSTFHDEWRNSMRNDDPIMDEDEDDEDGDDDA
ncbi:hypothetical protein HRI_002973400 [Hibiscus trionum]|uniref:Aminotransferase-like plant mobile domain-containing protein n=1 Tax=Hibiscus trionum TaxID=183268 RepID=A0A9W7IDE9_HIBTR|nr:hypothetical protein HRI_002973400 [Hibiscus trionum]